MIAILGYDLLHMTLHMKYKITYNTTYKNQSNKPKCVLKLVLSMARLTTNS